VAFDGRLLQVDERTYDLDLYRRVVVVGAGKASAAMALALEQILGERIEAGWINVKDGYTAPTTRVHLHEAGHPLPDERGVEGSRRIVRILKEAEEDDLVLALFSGGGSALMPLPAQGVTLADQETLTRSLLRCGATINEINAIRKHISLLKGGDLVRLAWPASVVSLMVSDVIGNPMDVIASGPTVADPTTFDEAVGVLEKYRLLDQMPASIRRRLTEGKGGAIPETPKPGDEVFGATQNLIVASNEHAAKAAMDAAETFGLNTLLLSTFVDGEAREVARVMSALAREIVHSGHPVARPGLVLSGGETTVTVRGQGVGGRNQELALAAAAAIAGLQNVAVVGLGTDGTDGPTDAAGAVATGCSAARANQQGVSLQAALEDNDSYHFFKSLGDLIITGPTNTNVNDLTFVFVF
jgi:hydroxypyruvate reductase